MGLPGCGWKQASPLQAWAFRFPCQVLRSLIWSPALSCLSLTPLGTYHVVGPVRSVGKALATRQRQDPTLEAPLAAICPEQRPLLSPSVSTADRAGPPLKANFLSYPFC